MTRGDLPTGTVTFMFTDVEGSTKLLHALGADAYADALAKHRRVLRDAFARHGGIEVDTQGDAFFVAFPTAPGALAAAIDATEALHDDGPINVRIGLHTGTPHLTDEGYVGSDVHRAARIAAAGHGGQILVSAATAAILEGAALRDLGLHRLKDQAAAERIFQADGDEHPPLKTLHRTNLPHGLDAMVGREHEVQDVARLLGGRARLVTLTGPGGTGKTRLAQAVGGELVAEFPDGVFWIPLADLRDPALVIGEVASVVGARAADLADAIGDRAMLLLLDNLEQIIQAGLDLAQVLEACPNLRMLITSRERLRVRGEVEYAVSPLVERDAVALFIERSGRTDGPIGELCRRLDNLPLAVELAAARAQLLTPAQILDRLGSRLDLFRGGRDADPRQATLRAAIDWSYELLAAGERQLFAALAVFRGGWTFEAAEAVADANLDDLGSLVDKSLVVRDRERFRMLDTIRAYAEERLGVDRHAESLAARHAAHFRDWAECRYIGRFAAEDAWLPQVAAETDNLRAALDWTLEHDLPMAIDLAGAVAPLWMTAGRPDEARNWLARLLPGHLKRDASRARALTHLGELNDDLPSLSEALEIWRENGDAEGEANTLEALGWSHDSLGDYAAAARAHEASLELRRRSGSPDVRGLGARAGLCHVLVATNESAEARTAASDLLEVARGVGAAYMEELALHFLADAELVERNWERAEVAYRAALAFSVEHDLVARATDELIGIAMAMAEQGRPRDALSLAAAAGAKQVEIGKGTDAWWLAMQRRHFGAARSALPRSDVEAAEAEGAASTFESIVTELVRAGQRR